MFAFSLSVQVKRRLGILRESQLGCLSLGDRGPRYLQWWTWMTLFIWGVLGDKQAAEAS